MNPTSPAAATQPRCWIGTGWISRVGSTSYPGDDGRQGDHRDDEQSGEVFGTTEAVGVAPRRRRRPSANAIHSGTAVSASEKLWMVSASSATDPDSSDDHQPAQAR